MTRAALGVRDVVAFAAFALGAFIASASCAQDYPVRPVRVIAPFSPGGAVD